MPILDLVHRRSHEWSFYARNASGKTLPQLQIPKKIASGGDLIVDFFFSNYTTALMAEDFPLWNNVSL